MTAQPLLYHTTFKFNGGVHPDECKDLSNQTAIEIAPTPPEMIIPISQHFGSPATPIVKVGDHIAAGQIIAEAQGNLSSHIHASASGKVMAIEKRSVAHPSGMEDTCVIIKTDDKNSSVQLPVIESPLNCDKQQLLQRVFEAGIVGLGGATFPSHIKLMAGVNTLIINAAECEPYITCDDRLMREKADELVVAFQLLRHILGAEKCIIGIEDNKPEAIKALENAVTTACDNNIRICVVPTKYPSGGEKQLIELITGKQVPQKQYPLALGIVLHNVATAYAVYRAIYFGEILTSRLITLTGKACAKPGNYWVKIGTPIDWLLNQYQTENAETVVMGGPMMGFQVKDTSAPVTKATNCLIAAAPQELQLNSNPLPCIRCGKCTEACPAGLLPQQLFWFAQSKNFEKAESYHLFDCIECGACSYVCPSNIPLVHYYRFSKTEIKHRQEEKRKADIARQRFEFKEERIARDKAERAEKHRLAAEARKNAAAKKGEHDEKKATIAEAVARAKARKKQQES